MISVAKNAASPKAFNERQAEGAIPEGGELRQITYLNTTVEQDHRFIKRRVKPGLGFFALETAWNTFQGYERMNMMRKGQVHDVEKGDIMGQVAFIASLFGVAASVEQEVRLHAHRVPPRVFATQPEGMPTTGAS